MSISMINEYIKDVHTKDGDKAAEEAGHAIVGGALGAGRGALTGMAIGTAICPGIGTGIGMVAGTFVGMFCGVQDKTTMDNVKRAGRLGWRIFNTPI